MTGFSPSRRRLGWLPMAAGLAGVCPVVLARDAGATRVSLEVTPVEVVGPAVPPVFGFGGNIWLTPGVFGTGVADRILAMPRLGMTRVSLGDQLLEHASSLADLKQRLEHFVLNDFLRRFRQRGGRVMLILDGTPRWLSSNPSAERYKGPNQPYFRVSPAKDMGAWAEVVEALVRHFNGVLGLDAWYEAWNEPNYYYLGSVEQFMAQYRGSVLGARRADPKARIGGPGISYFTGVGTGKAPKSEPDKLGAVTRLLDQRYLFRQFLEIAAATPLPELKLARLPVDFFSWHGFYVDPATVYAATTPHIRDVLAATGYARNTPIVISEWNLAAVPPYPEGDLNATHVGAAYTAASVLAMHASGVDAQVFQMYVDPGVEGYSGGLWTANGLPRASFQSLRLLAMLRGRQVRARSDDDWVHTAAFQDGHTLYVMAVASVPTEHMLKSTENVLGPLRNADFTRALLREGQAGQVLRGGPLPAARAREAREREQAGAGQMKADADRARQRTRSTLKLALNVRGLSGPPARVGHWLIDSRHANAAPELTAATRSLEGERKRLARVGENIRDALRRDGHAAADVDRLAAALAAGRPLDDALAGLDPRRRDEARRRVETVVAEALAPVRRLLEAAESTPQAALIERELAWPRAGVLEIDAEPHSVHLFVLTLPG